MRALNEHLLASKQYVQRVARIAQSVEQRIENPRVGSSILSPGTIYSKKPALKNAGFFMSVQYEMEFLNVSFIQKHPTFNQLILPKCLLAICRG
jgi:hypothetical protein